MDTSADNDETISEMEYQESRPNDREEDVSEENMDYLSVSMENTFDMTLPTTHSYLGHNLEELRGRTLLDDGVYANLPLIVEPSVMLFPGQTLPMRVFEPQTINAIRSCVEHDRTFGIIGLGCNKVAPIGTTAEIYECNYDLQQGFRLKAKGRQRFKILHVIIQGFKITAHVQILPEITLGPPFHDERLSSLNHLRIRARTEEEFKRQERVENLDAMVTAWPGWVYRQYDPMRLSLKIRKHLHFIESKGSSIPEEPAELSFWVAQNLLLADSERMALLNYDCAISRLQWEIKYLFDENTFVCANCEIFIGRQSHMFPMSKEGPHGTYCNPTGVIHDIITLYHVQGLILNDNLPSVDCTWFPGYAWVIATCNSCGIHMGWKFTAVEGNLKPKSFWGLSRRSLKKKEIPKRK